MLSWDAVAALFFVQSKNAQAAMAEFFDKLRRDRQALEARRLCENIENAMMRDALRVELALNHAGIPDSSTVSKGIFSSFQIQGDERKLLAPIPPPKTNPN